MKKRIVCQQYKDTKKISEEILTFSLAVNCTINFVDEIQFIYSNESLQTSLKKSDDLLDKITYSSDIINKIKDKASSYYHLKDFLINIKNQYLKKKS